MATSPTAASSRRPSPRRCCGFADADVLPFRFTNLSQTLESYAQDLQALAKRLPKAPAFDFTPLDGALKTLHQAATEYDDALVAASADGSVFREAGSRCFEPQPAPDAERAQDAVGDWSSTPLLVRACVLRAGFLTGYSAKTLPGVREAMEAGNWTEAADQQKVLVNVIANLTTQIRNAEPLALTRAHRCARQRCPNVRRARWPSRDDGCRALCLSELSGVQRRLMLMSGTDASALLTGQPFLLVSTSSSNFACSTPGTTASQVSSMRLMVGPSVRCTVAVVWTLVGGKPAAVSCALRNMLEAAGTRRANQLFGVGLLLVRESRCKRKRQVDGLTAKPHAAGTFFQGAIPGGFRVFTATGIVSPVVGLAACRSTRSHPIRRS